MRRLLITLFSGIMLFAACTEPESPSTGGGTGTDIPKEETPSFNTAVFSLIDLSSSSLSTVKSYVDAGQYTKAAEALLKYYRNRTGVQDDAVNLISPSITSFQQSIADWALSSSGYKFYTDGYATASGEPYSYAKDGVIDWALCESGQAEQTRRLGRLEWMQYQGLAYRVKKDEVYAKELIATFESYLSSSIASSSWAAEDASARLYSLCSAWQYILQSSNFSAASAMSFLAFVSEDASKLVEATKKEPCASAASPLMRMGKVFREMKDASVWAEAGQSAISNAYPQEWFDVLNLDCAGLEAVRSAVNAGNRYEAASALLKYWKTRSGIVNPNIDLSSKSFSDDDKSIADYALEENGYRFYISTAYYEDASAKKPYSYKASDGTINWQVWPTKEQEERYQLNRLPWMKTQAKVYYGSGNEVYSKSLMATYLDWFRQNPVPTVQLDYTVYPENQAAAYRNAGWTWRPLDVAARVIDQCDILEYIKASPNMKEEFLLQYLFHMAEQANHICANYSTTTNHLITQAQAVCQAGLLFPELKDSQKWISSGSSKLNEQVQAQYYSDGWLKDGDFHYHISSIEDFRSAMVVAAANNKSSLFPQSYTSSMKAMADVVLNMVYPNYSSVNMTDTRSDTWSKSVLKKNFNRYITMFPDEQGYLWMASEHSQGSAPVTLGKNFPDCGYYVLRSGWNATDIMMVLQNATTSPSEAWHRQWDNGNFELYVKGRQFFPDSGCYSYGGTTETNTQRKKFAATAMHNTLTLGGANITTCRGKMLASTTSGTTDILVLQNAGYSNLTHRRTVFFVERSFFVIVDEGIGSASGVVNLNFNATEGTSSQVVLDLSQNGMHTAFSDSNNLLVRTFSDGTISSESKEGIISHTINSSSSRQAYRVNQAKLSSSPVRFATIILPVDSASSHNVSATLGTYSASSVSAEVVVDGKTYKLETSF